MTKPLLLILTTSETHSTRLKNDLETDFDLKFSKSGTEALKLIQKKIPAAILMDHSIEDYMTYRFIDKVRNNPVTRNLPFVIVSRESSHSFVDQAVRSGASHYIGIPYERDILLDKLKIALRPGEVLPKQPFFTLPTSIETQVVSYGRISYITSEGIHFETRLALSPGDDIHFISPLAEGIGERSLTVTVKAISTDVFYNYPYAVDATWTDPEVAKKIKTWISGNKSLNSPKKSKILFISDNIELENRLNDVLNKSYYSARFIHSIEEGIVSYPFLKPTCVVVDSKSWALASLATQKKFVKALDVPWIIFGDRVDLSAAGEHKPFEAPDNPQSITLAIESQSPRKQSEADRLYFSKTLEDSRLRIFFKGRLSAISELGTLIQLEHDVTPPCNFQLDLKIFSNQNMRNPYIRVWPPARRLSDSETNKGQFKVALYSHFLGINNEQATAIRKWLRDTELQEQRKLIADIKPKLH